MKNEKLNISILDFGAIGDERGMLTICEGEQDIPFIPKRIFYIYRSGADVVRGKHANKITDFVLINVSGSSKVKIMDGRGNELVYSLNRPNTGIYIPHMVWKEMYDFSADSVLLCLASEHYDPNEYIRDYEAFLQEVIKQDDLAIKKHKK
ncbi:MAG: WxcM-like domain-containing protein [Anaerovibrio sp.]|uniref:sugar 3,4-ketoisomerase n=1 Tax=Anaerovibrio sp. TaxID=1872532 RepID=UPI0025BBCBF9|nr:FdtA/QdtA family cupin domain-containing protein [Anaerovibrio sp.]MBE6099374.1 WxcM-like domain-containing protein [Anaerovibrio sp.]